MIKRDLYYHFKNFGDDNTIFQITDENRQRYKEEEGYRHLLSFFSDNNSCIRRDIFEKYPYKDVSFAEDQIWAKQMIELGYKNCIVHSLRFIIHTIISCLHIL